MSFYWGGGQGIFIKMYINQPTNDLQSWSLSYIHVHQNNNIQGLDINGEEIKLTLFADDMTCFLKDKQSYSQLFATLKRFSEHSGLHVNNEKTDVFAIGSQQLSQKDFSHKVQKSIKILAGYSLIITN